MNNRLRQKDYLCNPHKVDEGIIMDEMEHLLKKNERLVKMIAERNTRRDSTGQIVFDRNDPWVKDDSWDELYNSHNKREQRLL